jgi:CheY-like chemotaxis protein
MVTMKINLRLGLHALQFRSPRQPKAQLMGHILVIDDDYGVRQTFTLALEACGYVVATAANGPSGLDAARANPPDMIFLDLKMPGMTGVETLQHLQTICPQTPVYVVTGFYEEYMAPLRDLQRSGANFDIARKPLSFAEIRAIADGTLASRSGPIAVTSAGAHP